MRSSTRVRGARGRRRARKVGIVGASALLAGVVMLSAGASGGAAATVPQADLSLSMTDNADPVFTGAALGYSITVGNAGPDAALRVVLIDRLPAKAKFRSVKTSQGSCALRRAGRDHVVCRLHRIGSGATVRIEVHLQAPKAPGTVFSTATVESAKGASHDPNQANNRHTEATTVNARPAPPKCKGERATQVGNDGDNVINGNAANNVVLALGGDDAIFPDGGDDLVCAGPGDDSVVAGGGADRIYGGPGHDHIRGEGGNDILRGGPQGDVVRGGDGADVLRGRRGADILRGRDGSDVLRGGRGADILRGGRGDDVLVGGRGTDRCFGGKGHDTFLHCDKRSQ